MVIKKINSLCGYGFFILGVVRIILVVLAFVIAGTAVTSMLSKGDITNVPYAWLGIIAAITAIVQYLLVSIAIPMVFINIKENPKISLGYLYGVGAFVLEIITPSFLSIFTLFIIVSLYMKAGAQITKSTSNYRNTKNIKANTEWFYNQEGIEKINFEKSGNNIYDEIRKEKKNEKIIEEIYEWRNLLDSGDIDEESYNDIKDKLLNKMKK